MQLQSRPSAAESPTAALSRPGQRAYLLMLGSSLCFAAMSACGHAAGQRADWRLSALARAGLVFLLAVAIARVRGITLYWKATPILWVRSITGSVSMLLTFYALTHLHVATAVTLTNTFPLWVTLLAWPYLGQRPTFGVALALISGIAGVVLIERPDQGEFRLASMTALLAAICTGVVMLGLHRLKNYDPLVIVVHFSAVATIFIGGFTIWSSLTTQPISLRTLADPVTLLLLAGVGMLGTVGQILMTAAFRGAAPQRVSVVGLSQVLFALGFDVLVWGRAKDWRMLLGMALIMAPVAWLLARRSGK